MPLANGEWTDSELTRPLDDQRLDFAILIVGGSTAAYAAALAALDAGAIICWVMPHNIAGGQWTAQGLPASDDSPIMAPEKLLNSRYRDPNRLSNGELFCISRSQRQFRDRLRQRQTVNGQVIDNPGGSWVSHLSVNPVTAALALNEPLASYIQSGHLTIISHSSPVQVIFETLTDGLRTVKGVAFHDHQQNITFTVYAGITLEATDLGDLLEVGEIDSRIGQEARSETNEAVLPDIAYPECQQAFTYCAILEKNTRPLLVGPPDDYDVSPWLQAKEFTGTFFAGGKSHSFYSSSGIFRYRRVGRAHNSTAVEIGNLSTLNWGNSPVSLDGPAGCGNDFKHGVLVGNSREERQEILKRGRDRTRSYIHFLQTQVASDLSTSPTMSWTPDGIALEPYIRESRRGIALTTIRHEDVAAPFFSGQARARTFNDSVGIGHYHYLDFHPNLAPGHVELTQDEGDCAPFTIALGAMVPIQTERLILSAKSIGTTHITNSAYRMHPVEWAIGEAGGYLAAFCQAQGITPRQVAADMRLLRQFQGQLAAKGIPLFWFNDVGHDDPDFEAIQVLATAGIVRTENRGHLNFNPAGQVSRGVVAVALVNVLALPLKTPAAPSFIDVPPSHFAYTSIEVLKAEGIVSGVGDQKFAPERPITREHFAILMAHVQASDLIQLFTNTPRDASVLRRRELSRTLYRLLKIQLNS